MRTLPFQGVPPRGSLRDLVAQEMLIRERRKNVSEHVYLGRIIAAGMQLPESLFQMWTSLFAMEVHHENYSPGTVKEKEFALNTLREHVEQHTKGRVDMFKKLNRLNISEDEMRPVTPAEREIFRRRLRRRHLRERKN